MVHIAYHNPKVERLLNSVTEDWTEADFRDLALAAIDQAGYSVSTQLRVADELSKED